MASYTVKKGDTLKKIAAANGMTLSELLSLNNISNPDLIQPGQVINLDSGGAAGGSEGGGSGASYTVKKGDTLNKIAEANGMTLSELLSLNNISNPDLIQPGQVINLDSGGAAGGSEGGGSTTKDAGGVSVTTGVPEEESKAEEGEGGGSGENPETDLTIMTSTERQFFFDTSTGLWYVSYGLPNSNRRVLFEATPSQMDSIYGEGFRPTNYQTVDDIGTIFNKPGVTFAGDVTEVAGTGTFESHYQQMLTFALDDNKLPSWMEGSDKALDILFIAQTEDKSDDWIIDQLSGLPEFRARFPGLKKYAEEYGIPVVEAIDNFLTFETNLKVLETRTGGNEDAITPAVVNSLISRGYAISEVEAAYKVSERHASNEEALAAFNQILAANGRDPLTAEETIDFLSGTAPSELYEIYEAAAFQESANTADLGAYFTAEDALAAAAYTEGSLSLADINGQMQSAASMLLRFRHELDSSKYGIDHEDLIDISLGLPPRSGANVAEIKDNITRAASEAQASRSAFQARPFTSFTSDGRIKSGGVSSGRAEY